MSLDISLYETKEIKCPHCGEKFDTTNESENVWSRNITHNLSTMASEAGIRLVTWDAYNIKAKDAIEPLKKGIADMKLRPEYYENFSALNGWGTYEQFLPWLEDYLEACENYPNSEIHINK